MHVYAMLFAVLGLTACDGLEAYPVVPHEGTWRVADLQVEDDTCGELPFEVDLETMTLHRGEDPASFTLSFEESEPAPCDRRGDFFECSPALGTAALDGGATITVATVADGWFADPLHLEGDVNLRLQCRGQGCDALEGAAALPCEISGYLVAEAEVGPVE